MPPNGSSLPPRGDIQFAALNGDHPRYPPTTRGFSSPSTPLWADFVQRMRVRNLPPPDDLDAELVDESGKVTGEIAAFLWRRDNQPDLVVVEEPATDFVDKPGSLDGLRVIFANPQSVPEETLDAVEAVLRETTP